MSTAASNTECSCSGSQRIVAAEETEAAVQGAPLTFHPTIEPKSAEIMARRKSEKREGRAGERGGEQNGGPKTSSIEHVVRLTYGDQQHKAGAASREPYNLASEWVASAVRNVVTVFVCGCRWRTAVKEVAEREFYAQFKFQPDAPKSKFAMGVASTPLDDLANNDKTDAARLRLRYSDK